jgi:hypothetical protein
MTLLAANRITVLHKAKALIHDMFTKYRMTQYYEHVYKQCELFWIPK